MERRDFIAAIAAALAAPASEFLAQSDTPSLKDACKGIFLIGTALDFRSANEFNTTELELIKSQFNAITPENSMKPGPVHPQEDSWNWTQPDALVESCQANNIKTFGHCLVALADEPVVFSRCRPGPGSVATSKSHPHAGGAIQRQGLRMGRRE